MKIEYYIKPRLYLSDQKLWCFSDEINQLDIAEIQNIIDSCSVVMDNKSNELYWGWHISSLGMKKETTTLSYNNDFVAEMSTIEIYNMLRLYRDKLQDYENKQSLG
jgi:hypothetical protein